MSDDWRTFLSNNCGTFLGKKRETFFNFFNPTFWESIILQTLFWNTRYWKFFSVSQLLDFFTLAILEVYGNFSRFGCLIGIYYNCSWLTGNYSATLGIVRICRRDSKIVNSIHIRNIKQSWVHILFPYLPLFSNSIFFSKDSLQKQTMSFFRLSGKWLIFFALKNLTYTNLFLSHQ